MEHTARRIPMGPAIRGQHCHTMGTRFHRPAEGVRPRYLCTFHSVESVLAILYKSVYMYVYICFYIYTHIQIHIQISGECSRCDAPDCANQQLVLRTAHLQAGTYVRYRNGGLLLFATFSPRSRAPTLGILLQPLGRTRVRAPALDGHHRQ